MLLCFMPRIMTLMFNHKSLTSFVYFFCRSPLARACLTCLIVSIFTWFDCEIPGDRKSGTELGAMGNFFHNLSKGSQYIKQIPEPQTALTFHGYQIQDGSLYENVHSSAQDIPSQLANYLSFLNIISKCFKGIDVHDKTKKKKLF